MFQIIYIELVAILFKLESRNRRDVTTVVIYFIYT